MSLLSETIETALETGDPKAYERALNLAQGRLAKALIVGLKNHAEREALKEKIRGGGYVVEL